MPAPELPEHLRHLPRAGDMYSHTGNTLRVFSLHPADSLNDEALHTDREAFIARLWEIFADIARSESDRYRDFELIGVGGAGVVISAEEKHLRKKVAIKVCREQAGSEAGARFQEEAQRTVDLKEIRTPRIPEIHGYGVTLGGRPFITMELVRGPTLASLAEEIHAPEHGAIRWREGWPREALEHSADALDALHAVHEHGYIHRDYKLANLKLTLPLSAARDAREVRILDWGLHRRYGPDAVIERPGGIVGTIDFMSPEQARGDSPAIGPASDIWSAGASLYTLLYGRSVVSAEGLNAKLDILRAMGTGGPAPVIDAAAVPRELAAVAARALQPAPEQRYRSAAEMAGEIRAFLERRYVAAFAEKQSTGGRLGYTVRARCMQAALWVARHKLGSAAATAVVLGGVAGAYQLDQRLEQQRIEYTERVRRESEREALGLRGQERLDSANSDAAHGRLAEAVLSLPPELERELRRHAELSPLADEIRRHREDWQRLRELRDEVALAYAGTLDSFDFRDGVRWSQPELDAAARIYLPGGLTPKELAALEVLLADSIYTREQRLELADRLIECFVLKLITDYPDVIHEWRVTPEARAHAQEVLAQIELLEELGRICDGNDAPDPARRKVFLTLQATAYRSLEQHAEHRQAVREAVLSVDSRGATSFLMALMVHVPAAGDEAVIAQRLRSSATVFMVASALDPHHLGAAHFAARRFHSLYRISTGEERHAFAHSMCTALQRCTALDPGNLYFSSWLAEACHSLWAEDRVRPVDKRVAEFAASLGVETGRDALRSMRQRGIPAPPEFLRRFGELCLDTAAFDDALTALQAARDAAPGDRAVAVRLACAQGASGTAVDASLLSPVPAEETDPTEYIYTAAAYALCAEQDPQRGGGYRDEALAHLERATEIAPQLGLRIRRLETVYFRSLHGERFDALAK